MRQKLLCIYVSAWACVCRLFSLFEHKAHFARAAICVYIYICICCKVSFICTGLLSQLSLASSHSHTFTHTHTRVQRYAAHEYGAPTAIMGNPLIVSAPRWWLERRTKREIVEGCKWKQSSGFRKWQPASLFFILFYSLDKWKAKTQLWHACTSHDLCSPLEREK